MAFSLCSAFSQPAIRFASFPQSAPLMLHGSRVFANRSSTRCCVATESTVSTPLRRTANYPPTVWHDSYIKAINIDFKEDEQAPEITKGLVRRFESRQAQKIYLSKKKQAPEITELKKDVRSLLIDSKDLIDQIENIDALQQLGISYHFQKEIKDILATIFLSVEKISSVIENDLHATSLLFRLLREHGFHVSTNILDNFKEEGGSFKSCISNDVQGMLSLYEASYLAVEGEDMLDEARVRVTECLGDTMGLSTVDPSVKEHVAHALELPLHWRMPRLHARWFIDQYERKANMNPIVCRLAKLDFNSVQTVYKKELKRVSRWWTNLALGKKLDFFRDRLVENFLWTVGWAFEPKFWRSREAMTKANCLITTIDDVYDVYGTLDELELFTDVVDRWDVNAVEQLPDYMKTCFVALFNTTNDTAYQVMKSNDVNVVPQLRKAWADLCKAYLVEARWYHKGYKPTFEEYMENAWISISGHVGLTHAYCTSEDITEEALAQLGSYLDVVRNSSMILRLYDDLATSTAELERGDVPKAIQCYMYENGVAEAVAREYLKELIISTWKKLNGEWIMNSSAEETFKSVALNLHRMAQCIYQHGDGYGEPGQETKDRVISLLIEPISL